MQLYNGHFDTYEKWSHCSEKGTWSDPCVLGQEYYPTCSLFTPEQHQQLSIPADNKNKDKKLKKDKAEKSEKGDKLVYSSSVTVIGAKVIDNSDLVDVSLVKAGSKTPDQ